MKTEQPQLVQYATAGEVRAALLGLSTADSVRLKQIGKLRAAGTGLEWTDLLNEAFARALGGQRQWPIGVSFVAFIAQTMRSIAHDERESRDVVVSMDEARSGEASERIDGEAVPVSEITPEREVAARQRLGQVESLFQDDAVALGILVATAEERTPESVFNSICERPAQDSPALADVWYGGFEMNRLERRREHALVDVAEKLLLQATDEEILSSAGAQAKIAASEVQAVVRKNIDAANSAIRQAQSGTVRKSRNLSAAAKEDANVLVSFLRALSVSRPDLSPRLHAVFRSSQPPDQVEVEKLAVELLKKHLEQKK